jgi:hypothetical protein
MLVQLAGQCVVSLGSGQSFALVTGASLLVLDDAAMVFFAVRGSCTIFRAAAFPGALREAGESAILTEASNKKEPRVSIRI